MTPTEKLLTHLENILPRRDWEMHQAAIMKMVAEVFACRQEYFAEILCRECGKPTMHMGDTCFSCGQKMD